MIFAYAVQIDGGLTFRRELEAASPAEATRFAILRHAREGTVVAISRVFEPPPRHGMRPPDPEHERPRQNFAHDIYDRRATGYGRPSPNRRVRGA